MAIPGGSVTVLPGAFERPTEGLARNLIQFLLAREQINLQKEQLDIQKQQAKLQEQEARRRIQEAEAQGRAGQALLGLMAQQDPQIQQVLQQAFPQTRANLATLGNANVPSSEVFNQSFDVQRIPALEAAATAERLQAFQQHRALLERTQAETEQIRTQTLATKQAIEHAKAIFPLEQEKTKAEIDLTRAQARLADAQAKDIAKANHRAAAQIVNSLMQSFSELSQLFGNPGWASRIVFGTNTPPTRAQLLQEELAFLDRAVSVASGAPNPQEMLVQLFEARALARIGQNINMAPEDQIFIDGLISQGMSPSEVYEAAKKAIGKKGSVITKEDLPTIVSYLKIRFGFEIPKKDKGFLRRIFSSLAPPTVSPETKIEAAKAGALPGRFGGF